jgi:hypothetical protein
VAAFKAKGKQAGLKFRRIKPFARKNTERRRHQLGNGGKLNCRVKIILLQDDTQAILKCGDEPLDVAAPVGSIRDYRK